MSAADERPKHDPRVSWLTGRTVFPSGEIALASIEIENGEILRIRQGDDRPASRRGGCAFDETHIIAPGFIDVQVNGALGYEFGQHPEALPLVSRYLARCGVTSFLPTITSLPLDEYDAVLRALESHAEAVEGAAVLGAHLEGPFLNPETRGAHPADLLRLPRDVAASWNPAAGFVRMVTLAPELDGAMELIKHLTAAGVVVGIGHSAADAATVERAIDGGARWGVHLFNSMRPLQARVPGVAGALLADDRVAVGLILDGAHVDARLVKAAWRCKHAHGGIVAVSDSSAPAGLGDGVYSVGARQLTKRGTSVYDASGARFGSATSLDKCLQNLRSWNICPLGEAISCFTAHPARVLGIERRKGALISGADADIVVLNAGLHPVMTIVGGVVRHLDESVRW